MTPIGRRRSQKKTTLPELMGDRRSFCLTEATGEVSRNRPGGPFLSPVAERLSMPVAMISMFPSVTAKRSPGFAPALEPHRISHRSAPRPNVASGRLRPSNSRLSRASLFPQSSGLPPACGSVRPSVRSQLVTRKPISYCFAPPSGRSCPTGNPGRRLLHGAQCLTFLCARATASGCQHRSDPCPHHDPPRSIEDASLVREIACAIAS